MDRPHLLVAGGTGFIGSALSRAALARGLAVTVLARHAPAPGGLPAGAQFAQGALDDAAVLRRLLPQAGWLVHLACQSVPGTALGPADECDANVQPTLRLLEALREFPAVRVLFVSSGGTVYGPTGARPVGEDAALKPWSGHGAGKVAIEGFLNAFCHQHRRDGVILRPANVYGPGQPVRPGFGIVPALLHAAAGNHAVDLYGGGAAVRDFLYIDDFTDLCLRLLERPAPAGTAATYNAGSGEPCSIEQLCTLVERVTGRVLQRRALPARSVDVDYVVLDSTRVRAATGWQPRTPLAEGLARTWQWSLASPP